LAGAAAGLPGIGGVKGKAPPFASSGVFGAGVAPCAIIAAIRGSIIEDIIDIAVSLLRSRLLGHTRLILASQHRQQERLLLLLRRVHVHRHHRLASSRLTLHWRRRVMRPKRRSQM
jgi:hypothetical protein